MEHKQNNQIPQSHNSHTSMDDERVLVDGRQPIFHVIMDCEKLGISEDDAKLRDMADEYAIISEPEANGGLIVYGKYSGEWTANPWSTRYLIRVLLENAGVSLPSFH